MHESRYRMFSTLFDWLLPNRCLICSFKARDYFCSDCLQDLPWVSNACPVCAKEMPSHSKDVCGECLIDPPNFNLMHVLFKYDFPITSLITQLKFGQKLFIANALGILLKEKILTWYTADSWPECIIPVPLHKDRLCERGYNQALEIARPLKSLQIPLNFQIAKRVVATSPQTFLSADARVKNIQHAFVIARPVTYRHVAILDDVVTTGSTVNELSGCLREAGVERVDVWGVARA